MAVVVTRTNDARTVATSWEAAAVMKADALTTSGRLRAASDSGV